VDRTHDEDVCARTPREATDLTHFVGTADQVAEKLEPYLATGLSDALVINYTGFCGQRYAEGAIASQQKLQAYLKSY
jgi:alkanesulfonate monooxygenase SsuD/methylene tetrahydromethanopterin reductase-like flavin-dependent oxidoreductase (luciferase family)